MVRLLGGMISVTAGLLVAMIVAAASAERRWVERGGVIQAHDLRAALTHEAAAALRAGLTLRSEGEAALTPGVGSGAWSMAVRIAAGECVGVIVGSAGGQRVQQVAFQPMARAPLLIAHDAMSTGSNGGGLVAHTQWCEREAVTRRVVALTEVIAQGQTPRGGTLRWALYRGRWPGESGPSRLSRGTLRAESLAALAGADEDEAEAARSIPEAARVTPAIPISMGLARLAPADDATYRALIAASQRNENPRVNPRIDPTPVSGVRWNTGLPINFAEVRERVGADLSPAAHDPVVDLGLNDFRRVLAVVDPARVGASCLHVALLRRRYGYRAEVWSIEEGRAPRAIPAVGGVAIDRSCERTGPRVYVAPIGDQAPWRLWLLRPGSA